jgi:succinate dehydrogenase / fumarate reductase flavoprotein subunit
MRRISSMEIARVDHCMVTDLIQSRGRVVGAFGIDERTEDPEKALKVFSAKATVLATGGAGEAFALHVFPVCMTGDGYAMAYRAGAELVNMEFIQIGLSSTKTRLACSGSMMRAIPRFVNEEGKEFLEGYFPKEFSRTRIYNLVFEKGASWPVSREKETHLVDVAVFKVMAKGRRVFLDYSSNPKGFRFKNLERRWEERYRSEIKKATGEVGRNGSPLLRLKEINPAAVQWLKENGIDLDAGERIEIAPSVQHFQGGVKIRERGNTSLRGLYAAGECAGGQHGANRPGGNALLDGQVFGRIAGHEATVDAKSRGRKSEIGSDRVKNQLAMLREMCKGLSATEMRREVQSIASRCASVVRTEQGLKKALSEMNRLRREGIGQDEKGLVFAVETRNLMDVAELVLSSSLLRKESRGPHLFFKDVEDPRPLPPQDPGWRKYIVARSDQGRMALEKRPPVNIED